MDKNYVRKRTADELRRTELCVQQAGGQFQHLLEVSCKLYTLFSKLFECN